MVSDDSWHPAYTVRFVSPVKQKYLSTISANLSARGSISTSHRDPGLCSFVLRISIA